MTRQRPDLPDAAPRDERRWVSVALVVRVAGRLREDSQQLTRDVRWCWGLVFGVGFILAQAASVSTVWLGRTVVEPSWAAWEQGRPTGIADGLASPGGLQSFPSGHVAQAVFAYGILAYLWCRRSRSRGERLLATLLLLVAIGVVAVGRLRLGAHWPSDVGAAVLVAGVWTCAVAYGLHQCSTGAKRL